MGTVGERPAELEDGWNCKLEEGRELVVVVGKHTRGHQNT